ncbi:MAG: hypothetical protein AB8B50_13500 [Pirellulaceae bacterium]
MQLSLLIRGIVGLASVGAISSWLGLIPGVELGDAGFSNLVTEASSGSIDKEASGLAEAGIAANARVVKFQASGSFSDVPPLPSGSSRSSFSDTGGPSRAGGIQLPVLPDSGGASSRGGLLPPVDNASGVVPPSFPSASNAAPIGSGPGALGLPSRQTTLPAPATPSFQSQPAGLPQSPSAEQLGPSNSYPQVNSRQGNSPAGGNTLRDPYAPSSSSSRGVSNYDAAQRQLQQGVPAGQDRFGGNGGFRQQAEATPANTIGYNREVRPQSQSASARQIRTQSNGSNVLPSERNSAGVGTRPGEQGFYDPRSIVSGPPFVSPPPRGRYPTSRYNNALFQNAAYQRTVAQNVQAGRGVNGVGQLTSAQAPVAGSPVPMAGAQPQPQAGRANLPQFAASNNIYPTAAYQCNPNVGVPLAAPTLPPPNNVPGTGIPPTLPPNLAPNLYSANNNGYAPLLSLGQEGYNVQLGRGVLGQPTVYVPGQPVRNFLRYLSP